MGHTLDLKFLQLVVAIAEEGTLTRAGKRLHLTQSALSHQLAALEDRFGVEIFSRRGRRLQLTALGDRLVLRARDLVNQVEALEADLLNPRPLKQQLRVVTQCFTCYHWLPALLPPFEALHPNVTIALIVESTRHAMEALDAGVVDLAITPEQGPELQNQARYLSEHVFDDELMLAVAPEHALASRDCIRGTDLRGQRLLLHPPSDADRRWFEQKLGCATTDLEPCEVQRIPVTDSIIDLVSSGYGCALLSKRSACDAARQGRLLLKSFAPEPLRRSFFAFSCRNNAQQLPLGDFLRVLGRHCQSQLPAQ